MSKEIVNEAINMICTSENVSAEYLKSVLSPDEIVSFARKLNRAREANMDAIRESWY